MRDHLLRTYENRQIHEFAEIAQQNHLPSENVLLRIARDENKEFSRILHRHYSLETLRPLSVYASRNATADFLDDLCTHHKHVLGTDHYTEAICFKSFNVIEYLEEHQTPRPHNGINLAILRQYPGIVDLLLKKKYFMQGNEITTAINNCVKCLAVILRYNVSPKSSHLTLAIKHLNKEAVVLLLDFNCPISNVIFEHVIKACHEKNVDDAALFVLIEQKLSYLSIGYSIVSLAAQYGMSCILSHLFQDKKFIPSSSDLDTAIRGGHVKAIRVITAHLPVTLISSRTFGSLAAIDEESFHKFIQKGTDYTHKNILVDVRDRIAFFRCLLNGMKAIPRLMLHNLVEIDDYAALRYLLMQPGFLLYHELIGYAIRCGSLKCLQMMETVGRFSRNLEYTWHAVRYSKNNILEHMLENGYDFNISVMHFAVQRGNITAVVLLQNAGCPYDTSDIILACSNGHMNIVQILADPIDAKRDDFQGIDPARLQEKFSE